MASKSYRDLEVWQEAMDLVVCCYQLTEGFPENESMASLANCRDRSCRYRPISLKARDIIVTRNFYITYQSPTVP
jgi:hypothetical protein